jgi:hypothetical protein
MLPSPTPHPFRARLRTVLRNKCVMALHRIVTAPPHVGPLFRPPHADISNARQFFLLVIRLESALNSLEIGNATTMMD